MPRADRLFALAQLLSGPARRSLEDLAEKLGASPRSIYRDLAHLEERGIPIERVQGRYRIVEGASLRAIPLTARERLLLTVALENPTLEKQAAFRSSLRQLRMKLAALRECGVTIALAGPDRTGAVPGPVLEAIEKGIADSHSISIFYESLSSGETTWRAVDPWALVHRSGAWYVVGRCHRHDEPRTFRLDRILDALPIGRFFERPSDFDPDEWFANSWDVATSRAAPVQDVTILFDAGVAPLIEHALHHPEESKRQLADGRLEYRVRIGPLDEIARWIAGFGGAAVAIEPPELAARVRAIAQGTASAHRQAVRRSARRVRLARTR